MTLRVVIAAVLLCAAAMGMEVPSTVAEFARFMAEHEKNYESVSEMLERYKIFADNLRIIQEYNQRQSDVVLGANQFADMTQKEFRDKYLRPMKVAQQEADAMRSQSADSQNEANPRVDWRKKGKVSKVKNQYSCGSCWAFSATGSLESFHAITKGTMLQFSEQELVDCSRKYGNEGCNGGWMHEALHYVGDHGISLESDYPYEARDGRCKSKEKKRAFQIHSYRNVTSEDNDELLSVINKQPVSIAVKADMPVFMFYKGGIITHDCGTEINHGILLVGADIDDDRKLPYWIVKNSWGRGWGMEGFGYIKRDTGRGKGVCGIAQMNSYPYD